MDETGTTAGTIHVPKLMVICNLPDTAPVWGYILRRDGMIVVLERSIEKALDHWSSEMPDLTVIDLDVTHEDPVELCKTIRTVSVAPILLLLPAYDEKRILDAYQAGADDVIIKPISPAVFQAKIRTWLKRGWTIPLDGLRLVHAGRYRLEPAKRCLVNPQEQEIKLTHLEFRLLHLLMGKPGEVFSADDLIQSIWGIYGSGDHVLLKNVVYRLRKKIEADPTKPELLITWPGGYSFQG